MTTTDSAWRGFLNALQSIKTPHALNECLTFFLTHEEKATLTTRYLLTQELLKGELTQREIAKKFGVSIAKITRGSNSLKLLSPALKQELTQLLLKS